MRRLLLAFAVFVAAAVCSGEIWSSGCEYSISDLEFSQQQVADEYEEYVAAVDELEHAGARLETAKQEVDDWQFQYDLCKPSTYDDCEWERLNLNYAIDEYNSALSLYNSAYDTYESELDDLNSEIRSFSSYVDDFTASCLE